MSNEVWRQIDGYPNHEISNLGRVRSFASPNGIGPRRSRPLIMKPRIRSDGYVDICLRRNGEKRTYSVHGLVATHFIGPRPEGAEVCHNDGNRQNNRLDNLRYGTPKENCADRAKHGNQARFVGEENAGAKLTAEGVIKIRQLINAHTQAHVAKMYEIRPQTVSKIVKRELWKHI